MNGNYFFSFYFYFSNGTQPRKLRAGRPAKA